MVAALCTMRQVTGLSVDLRFDIIAEVAQGFYARHLFGFDFEPERTLHDYHDVDEIEAVDSDVVLEQSLRSDSLFVDLQFLYQKRLDFLFDFNFVHMSDLLIVRFLTNHDAVAPTQNIVDFLYGQSCLFGDALHVFRVVHFAVPIGYRRKIKACQS